MKFARNWVVYAVLLFLLGGCFPLTTMPTPTAVVAVSGSGVETPPVEPSGEPPDPPATEIPIETSIPEEDQNPAQPPTEVPPPAPLVFAVIGDFGLDSPILDQVSDMIKSWDPEFIITVGDNNYPNGAAEIIDENIGQYFQEYIHPYHGIYGDGADQNRFFPTLGNHDWLTTGAQPYLDYFTLPGNERYYDFVWGEVHFFALDSDSREPDGVGVSSIQAQWLKEKLADSTATWQVVFMHHPPYSSGHHGSTDYMQWPFGEWGADVVLSGHDHSYERLVVDDLLYIVNGLGGYPSRYWFVTDLPGSQIQYRAKHGATRVTVDQNGMTFEMITVDGDLIDLYTLPYPVNSSNDTAGLLESVVRLPDPELFSWERVAVGYDSPVLVTNAGDGSGRLFILEQPGRIRVLNEDRSSTQEFLDIRDRVGSQSNEQGLLGLAFHPDYAVNGYFYVYYTDRAGDTVISRYQVSSADPNRADPGSELTLLAVSQPYGNHNGGHLEFGPDGYLYAGLGDGGSGGDPQGNAQNLGTLLGKILRLNIDEGIPYSIPVDNPFSGADGRAEIWASGLRNPWRFSFDPLSGDLYIGDVGQNIWEEVDYLAGDHPGGANFGWDFLEGTHSFEGVPPSGSDLVPPVWEYDHATGGCSVTGGAVYRGQQLSDFYGVYLFGDYCSGFVWGMVRDAQGVWQADLLFQTGQLITSFGIDEAGEVYLVGRGGEIFQLRKN